MYLNVNIVGGPSVVVSIVSVAELRALQKDVRDKSTNVDNKEQEIIDTGDQYLLDIATEGDSELAQIANAGDSELSQIANAGDDELNQVAVEGSNQRILVRATGAAEVLIVEGEGDDQVTRVRAVGNVQEAIVENEGDTQVARVIGYVDEAEDYNGWAEAYSLTSDAWANTAMNTDVVVQDWDAVNNVLVPRTIPGARSAYHWEEIAKTVSAGLTPMGTWDSVDCSLPPEPTVPPGELANGYFYIVSSVTGDTSLCPNLSEGDWIVWSGDLPGDGTIEGGWVNINWTFDWAAITGVPENVSNALSRSGGTMTQPILASYDASAPAAAELVARSYIDALAALFMPVNAAVPFTAVPRTTADQGTDLDELTKREFVEKGMVNNGEANGNFVGDLNTLFKLGTAYVTTDASNMPSSEQGYVVVSGNGLNRGAQTYVTQTGRTYARSSSDGITWTAWIESASTGYVDTNFMATDSTHFTGDIDTLKSAGTYVVNGATSTVDATRTYSGTLIIPAQYGGQTQQIYLANNNGGVFIRSNMEVSSMFKQYGAMTWDGSTLAITL